MSIIHSYIMVNLDKPKGWIIVRDSPNGLIRISGLFTIEENAKAELQKRLTKVKNSKPRMGEESWGDPQLLEITIEQKLL